MSIPKAVRDYDSVEFAAEKRFANNWYLRSSYLWSRLYGNYSGLSQSDENGRTSPNVGRLWDYPLMMFQDGGSPALGRLATDRPHQLKAAFIYQFNFGTSIGVNQFVASGLPVSREIGTFGANNLPVNYLGRLSDGRTPTFSQTDMLVQHGFRIGGGRQLQVSLNVLNLFNQDTAIACSRRNMLTGVRRTRSVLTERAEVRTHTDATSRCSRGSEHSNSSSCAEHRPASDSGRPDRYSAGGGSTGFGIRAS